MTRRKPEGYGKKFTGWVYWNGHIWSHVPKGRLGTLCKQGFNVKRLEA